MKRQKFSMIELLVVMAIIIILTGMVLAAVSIVRQKSKKVLTTTLMKQLEVAISSYQTTYGILPFTLNEGNTYDIAIGGTKASPLYAKCTDAGALTPPNATSMLKTSPAETATTYDNLLQTLQGQKAILNPRKQKFLELESDGESYKDAYGNPFQIAFDLTYDENLHGKLLPGIDDSKTLKRSIAIWSLGRDLKSDMTDNATYIKDNINSWDSKK